MRMPGIQEKCDVVRSFQVERNFLASNTCADDCVTSRKLEDLLGWSVGEDAQQRVGRLELGSPPNRCNLTSGKEHVGCIAIHLDD